MFRKTMFALAALAVMVSAPVARAAEQGDVLITLNAGVALPMGDFGDFANLGFGGGVGLDYFMTPTVAIGVDGAFTAFTASDEYEALLNSLATDPVEARFSMINGGAHAKFMFGGQNGATVQPYALVGAGIYNFKETLESNDPAFNGDVSDSKFGGRAGLGMMFGGGGQMGFGAEAAYHLISTEGESTTFITIMAILTFGMSR